MSFSIGSFILQIVSFAILLFFLYKYAFGPLLGMMEKRQNTIANQLETADKKQKEAENLLKEHQAALQEAREEAHEIIEKAKASSRKMADEILEASKAEAERMKGQALQEINLEKEKAVAALREQVASLSVLLASKIIEKELDAKTQSKLIDDMMKQVGEGL